MAREIKFRTWSLQDEELYEVTSIGFETGWCWYSDHIHGEHQAEITKDLIIEQYTGLHDKNGMEIYEGDIVESDLGIGVVAFIPGAIVVEWSAGESEGSMTHMDDFIGKQYEVIGNIHENPGLIEVTE